jgi:hypothetical protein
VFALREGELLDKATVDIPQGRVLRLKQEYGFGHSHCAYEILHADPCFWNQKIIETQLRVQYVGAEWMLNLMVHNNNWNFERFLSSPERPEELWCFSSFLLNVYGDSFSGLKQRGVKLTLHLHILPRNGWSYEPTPCICHHGVDSKTFACSSLKD